MKNKTTLTKELLIDLYINQRKTTNEIASITGYTGQTILKKLHKFNISVRNYVEAQVNTTSNIDIEWLVNEYVNNKRTLTDLSKELCCTVVTLSKKLKSRGIEIDKRLDLTKNNLKHYSGEKSPTWKGGRYINKSGYVKVMNLETGEYELEHRMVMEKHIGRKLEPFEQVHHINRIKTDNRVENLVIMSISEHSRLHSEEDGMDISKYDECTCAVCGVKFLRRKKEIIKHKNTYCSQKCYNNRRLI